MSGELDKQIERMERFRKGTADAVKKGCEGREVIQIAGGPYVACPGCADCDPKIKRLREIAKEATEAQEKREADDASTR